MEQAEINELYKHLFLIAFLLIIGVLWVIGSWYFVYVLDKNPTWFARSGAILVMVSIFSNLVTRTNAKDMTAPDLVNIVDSIYGEEKVERKKEHWSQKINLPKKLAIFELLLGSFGTIVWAYGDLWF